MTDLYALFKSEEAAQRAAKKIIGSNKEIKISMFDSNRFSEDDGVLFNDASIIGSPSGMLAFQNSDTATDSSSFPQTEFSSFFYADFIITKRNSLLSPTGGKADFPYDSFSTGLYIKAPASSKSSVKEILRSENATLI